MGSKGLPLKDVGIYHNLPTFAEDIKGLTAIVTGANGISGFHTMRVLLQSPERWKKVYAMSRRPPPKEMMALLPEEARSRVEHVASDFLSSPEEIAKHLKDQNVKPDYVFFYSYLQPKPDPGAGAWSNVQQLIDTNTALLRNFLDALDIAKVVPKRFLLQTGAKQYGGHIGPILRPGTESDPRVDLEGNFYYPQEDMLFDYCKRNKTSWNVVRPAWILGAVNNAQMNAFYPLAVYAAVQARLGKPLEWPGDMNAWLYEQGQSTAMLTGYLTEWAVLEENCKNEAFNSTDGTLFNHARFWPRLGEWFGVDASCIPEQDESKYNTFKGSHSPGPLGYGGPTTSRYLWTFQQWASDPKHAETWKEIMKEHDLVADPFEDVENSFVFSDFASWGGQFNLSTNKAKLLGFSGFVDTYQALFEMYNEMSKIGMLPPMKVEEAKPSV